MNTTQFKGLVEKVKSELEGKKCTFYAKPYHYVFHDKDEKDHKEGLSLVFTLGNVEIKKFTLENLVKDHKGSHYLNSTDLASSYYLLTSKQNSKLLEIIENVLFD